MTDKALYQVLTEELGKRTIESTRVPSYIAASLNPAFPLRPYQERAFKYFISYWQEAFDGKPRQNHQLLYHMATGSGKTIMMAGLMVYLHSRGYRNFIFFVNSTNIIQKTRDNFLNKDSAKYLFADTITVGDKRIEIREVENFQSVSKDDINIVFTTIQGLHMALNAPRENSITYEDFSNQRIVLISDEAHHINVETKKGVSVDQEELFATLSWERTVERIFRASPENTLLEFTATVDFSDVALRTKYLPKLLYDYALKEFRTDGYSKEVKVLQADLPPFDRAFQAILLSQHRRKVFEKHHLNIKPVILFKSRTIKESQLFFETFNDGMAKLTASRLARVRKRVTEPAIAVVFDFLDAQGITLENFIEELQDEFAEEKLIIVNSKEESETKQLAVNALESNEYRAVFAVDKLNEGWDVLNLFDIVRLYDTRDAKAGRFGKTTMSEAQLIGRGARYCPFRAARDQPLYERKFDSDLTNELRVCEELYYHSAYNPKYIQELYAALREIGMKPVETRERKVSVKASFRRTSLYKAGHVFLNEREAVDRSETDGLNDSIIREPRRVALATGYTTSTTVFDAAPPDTGVNRSARDYLLRDLGVAAVRKALQRSEFYEFANLKRLFPALRSIQEFITSPRFLGSVRVEVTGLAEQVSSLSADEKVVTASKVLSSIADALSSEDTAYRGSKVFRPYMIKDVFVDKTLSFMVDEGTDREFGRSMNSPGETSIHLDLSKRDWYVFDDCYGTSEEKLLVQYIDKRHHELSRKYADVYLIRNERHFKLFAFDDGRALEPDFVLYLVGKELSDTMHFQVFIEPKGAHLLKADEWKERFLERIKNEFEIEQLFANREYVLWGLPFYNSTIGRLAEFEKAFDAVAQ